MLNDSPDDAADEAIVARPIETDATDPSRAPLILLATDEDATCVDDACVPGETAR